MSNLYGENKEKKKKVQEVEAEVLPETISDDRLEEIMETANLLAATAGTLVPPPAPVEEVPQPVEESEEENRLVERLNRVRDKYNAISFKKAISEYSEKTDAVVYTPKFSKRLKHVIDSRKFKLDPAEFTAPSKESIEWLAVNAKTDAEREMIYAEVFWLQNQKNVYVNLLEGFGNDRDKFFFIIEAKDVFLAGTLIIYQVLEIYMREVRRYLKTLDNIEILIEEADNKDFCFIIEQMALRKIPFSVFKNKK